MMRLRADQLATLRAAVIAERQRDLARRLADDHVVDAPQLAEAVTLNRHAMGLRTAEHAYRVATILAEAQGTPGFDRWHEVLTAILYNEAASPDDRLQLIEREVMPRLRRTSAGR
jgi:hypothetical protein